MRHLQQYQPAAAAAAAAAAADAAAADAMNKTTSFGVFAVDQ